MVRWDWGGFSEPVRYCAIGGGTVPRKYRLYHPLGNDRRSGRRAYRGHFIRPVPVTSPVQYTLYEVRRFVSWHRFVLSLPSWARKINQKLTRE